MRLATALLLFHYAALPTVPSVESSSEPTAPKVASRSPLSDSIRCPSDPRHSLHAYSCAGLTSFITTHATEIDDVLIAGASSLLSICSSRRAA